MIASGILIVGTFGLSWLLTLFARRYAIKHSLFDIPNPRSSHTVPTPRGGGIAIGASLFAAMIVLINLGWVDIPAGLALVVGGGVVALTGWLDDRYGLSAWVRVVVHLSTATWAVWCLGGLPSIDVGVGAVTLGWLGSVLAVLGVAGLTNLFNFMDGIDGLAGVEAVCVGVIGGGLLALAGQGGLSVASLALAAAAGGFLMWNWPPAKIFMGDVGSGLVGYAFGVSALASERVGALPLLVWVILLGVFIVDATATLIRRVARGERWYEAHRSHAYQRAVQAGYSHRHVTMGVLGLNLLLGLVAVGGWLVPLWLPVALALAIAALLVLWFRFSGSAPASIDIDP